MSHSVDRYAGCMPDNFFRKLKAHEEKQFRQWAHDHWSAALPEAFPTYHPVIRDEWRKIDKVRS